MRLIDADDLSFYCHYDGDCMADKNKCKRCNDYTISFADVQEQPTAFDIDKVVEEITKLRNDAYSYAFKYNDEFNNGQSDGLEKALDIINEHLKQR